MITFWYQFIDKGWYTLQVIEVIIVALTALYYLIWVPESPKWLYTWRKYKEARDVLTFVAGWNAVDDEKIEEIKKMEFDKERKERLRREENQD